MELAQRYPRVKIAHWLVLLMIIALAVVLRFLWIGTFTPHFDELWHLELSTGRGSANLEMPRNVVIPNAPDVTSLDGAPPWWKIWGSLNAVTHPPLFPIVLRFWRVMFGQSLAVGRSLAALLGSLGVVVLFDVVRLLARSTTLGLWAAAIYAVSSAQIETSQDLRNYELALLALLLAADAMARITIYGSSPRRLVALFLSAEAALLLHYFAAITAIAIGLFALLELRGKSRRDAVIALVMAAGVFAVIWGPQMLGQVSAVIDAGANSALGNWKFYPKLWTMRLLATMPLRQLFDPRSDSVSPAMGSATLYLIPWALLISQWRQRRRAPDSRTPSVDSALLLWTIWLTCTAITLAALDLTRTSRHLDQLRHTIFVGPAVVGILVALGSRSGGFVRNGLPAFVVVTCVLALGLTYTRQNPSLRDFSKQIVATHLPNAPIVFYSDPPHLWQVDMLYLGAGYYSGTFPRTIIRLNRPAEGALLQVLRANPKLLFIVCASERGPAELLPGCVEFSTSSTPYVGRVSIVGWPNTVSTDEESSAATTQAISNSPR